MFVLWAGNMAIQKLEFLHETPAHYVFHLKADSLSGHRLITVNNASGTYRDWVLHAQRLVLNTNTHIVKFMTDVKAHNKDIFITAKTGSLNLTTRNITGHSAHIKHNNLLFGCAFGTYNRKAQRIACEKGKLLIKVAGS